MSRPHGGEPNLAAIRGKGVPLISCSAGALGGSRAQAHLRRSFQVMGCVLIPETVTLPFAETAFAGDEPKHPAVREFVTIATGHLVDVADKMTG